MCEKNAKLFIKLISSEVDQGEGGQHLSRIPTFHVCEHNSLFSRADSVGRIAIFRSRIYNPLKTYFGNNLLKLFTLFEPPSTKIVCHFVNHQYILLMWMPVMFHVFFVFVLNPQTSSQCLLYEQQLM